MTQEHRPFRELLHRKPPEVERLKGVIKGTILHTITDVYNFKDTDISPSVYCNEQELVLARIRNLTYPLKKTPVLIVTNTRVWEASQELWTSQKPVYRPNWFILDTTLAIPYMTPHHGIRYQIGSFLFEHLERSFSSPTSDGIGEQAGGEVEYADGSLQETYIYEHYDELRKLTPTPVLFVGINGSFIQNTGRSWYGQDGTRLVLNDETTKTLQH
jgi:hypothetical protein